MAPFGPWGDRHVAVAVSGGPDSLALAWMAKGWGCITVLTVDHGLRAGSASEASRVVEMVRSWGGIATVLTLTGLDRGPALAARARRARHRALQDACRKAGLPDLLLAHHAGDQAETVAMRRERGSGAVGLAGMAAVAEAAHARVLRPLLGVPPGRLKATLRQAGLTWTDDPANRDVRTGRGRVRALLADPDGAGEGVRRIVDASMAAGRCRASTDAEVARVLAGCTIYPGGYAVIPNQPIMPEALAALLRAVAGSDYVPSPSQVARLARAPGPATLGGCRMLPAGRLGPGWLVVREAAAMAAAQSGERWDGRFHLRGRLPAGGTLGPLGPDCARFRSQTRLPAAVLQTLPVLKIDGTLVAGQNIAFSSPDVHDLGCMIEPDCWPPAGAPFGMLG